ncbi:DUF3084 domain-containing protein [Prochlorococcus sp. MIT 1223]|uniref:DUF3084 domain-containing protein n=1 Tax=Prochlorococcus sp. MIT 1223 TaxID=3096217 RepID=UPI002A749DBD|nr:DUF3084 domain-containing protein [Prochlorococcus sp. MIT 1223]
MTGWLLIISLLILGGLLSTLGDLLGSRIGKARLSLFKLRPRRTAVFITVITGSLISAISLSLMLLVSRELRVGLFELKDLQSKLQNNREDLLALQNERQTLEDRIVNGEKVLKQVENNFIALRRGDVVISSGQSLASSVISIKDTDQIQKKIENLLQIANYYSYLKIKPGEKPDKRILLIRKDHIKKLEQIIRKRGSWLVHIRSADNVLKGEDYIYAFPEVIQNSKIVLKDEIIASINLDLKEINTEDDFTSNLKILLSSTLAEVKRRGSLSSEIKINPTQINKISKSILLREKVKLKLNAVSVNNSFTADPISIKLMVNDKLNEN